MSTDAAEADKGLDDCNSEDLKRPAPAHPPARPTDRAVLLLLVRELEMPVNSYECWSNYLTSISGRMIDRCAHLDQAITDWPDRSFWVVMHRRVREGWRTCVSVRACVRVRVRARACVIA
jgi:hypothetical protein